ncbi:YCII-related protein [Kribbella flavida DSM 17836]|uniref:YCII-related protein n=1 Tax=Kribbella flavida (strain DSM 17836 / JCM 10339 / NBRC 14399) TaxID=479435 RepID=D2PU15_KRIFD|nr:YciI family protein [Kribbella flavida]ADB33298.1 YCII-related protein [Kribbella flavida DSM 17836]
MKYVLLMQATKQRWDAMPQTWSEQDVKVMVDFMHDLNEELQKSGELVEVRGLPGPDHMKTLQADENGEPIITDGPFSETKEVLAGYWVVDVATEQRALEIALKISLTPGPGGRPVNQPVEIHPEGVAPTS